MSTLTSAILKLAATLNEGHGIETVESALFDVVNMLRDDPALKSQFLNMVEQTFEKRWPYELGEQSVPSELIELATHELRWPEFEIIANRRINHFFGGDEVLSVNDVASGVKRACADNWEDREFFERYTK